MALFGIGSKIGLNLAKEISSWKIAVWDTKRINRHNTPLVYFWAMDIAYELFNAVNEHLMEVLEPPHNVVLASSIRIMINIDALPIAEVTQRTTSLIQIRRLYRDIRLHKTMKYLNDHKMETSLLFDLHDPRSLDHLVNIIRMLGEDFLDYFNRPAHIRHQPE